MGFFGAGVAACADVLCLQSLQLERALAAPLELDASAGGVLSQWANAATGAAARWAARVAAPRVRYVGSSAGVCGLMGIAFCLAVEELAEAARGRAGRRRPLGTAVKLSAQGLWFWNEVSRLRSGGMGGVDHAGHLTGFATGCAVYAALRWRASLLTARP